MSDSPGDSIFKPAYQWYHVTTDTLKCLCQKSSCYPLELFKQLLKQICIGNLFHKM